MSDLGALNTAIGPSPESKIKGDSSVFLWRGGLRLMRPRFWLPPTVLSLAVVTAVQYNYLPGHVLAELFSMMIAWVFFGLAWKTYALEGNRFLIMLGFGFFWIGAVDFLHMLAYKGMNLLPFTDANEATQLWVCARALQALTLVFCPLLARWGGSIWVAFLAIGALAIASAVAVFYGHFPQAFVEGEGLTTFKISAEYVIIALHAVSIALVARIPEAVLRSEDRAPIIYFIIISMISEFAFTLYVDVYGIANLVGHVLKIWAFWLIFDATIQINFDGPHWTLKRLSQVVEQSPAMVVITDRSGVVEYVNPQFQADTGYSADEAVGRHIDFLKSDEMPQRQIDEMWQVIGRGDIWHGYFRNRRKNGSLYWDKSTIAPIRDPRGN
ncbi:MASE3 domain-containing protein, partial [Ferrovibrio sp.]|uniref:MASE3 domain-containing protein n=1 Tax=Ferrovibrio sp. TaxID=1917215 RepID=UPI00262AA0C5